MSKTTADGPYQPPPGLLTDGEGYKQRPPIRGSANGNEPILKMGVLHIGRDKGHTAQKCLDLGNGNAMLAAMCPVAVIPIKP